MTLIRRRTASPLLIRDVIVLDPKTGSLTEPSDILIDQAVIQTIGPAGQVAANGATTLDADGRVALPGLIDCHLHTCGIYLMEVPEPVDLLWVPGQILKNLRALAESGVTTTRDMAAPFRLIGWLRSLAAGGWIVSPRLLISGPILTAPKGHPSWADPLDAPISWMLGQLKVELTTETAAVDWVDRLASRGVDFIKVAYSSLGFDDARTPVPRIRDEVVRAITDRAHGHGLPVAVHHTWSTDLAPLLDLPFDTLEHLTIDKEIGQAEVDQIRERDLPVTTTLIIGSTIDYLDEVAELVAADEGDRFESKPRAALAQIVGEMKAGTFDNQFFGRDILETGTKFAVPNLMRLKEAGVLIGAGTDSGGAITPCGQIVWELQCLERAGFTPLEAVRAATSDAARVIGRPELGILEAGRPADVILCRENPAQNLATLERIDLVVGNGVILKDVLASSPADRASA